MSAGALKVNKHLVQPESQAAVWGGKGFSPFTGIPGFREIAVTRAQGSRLPSSFPLPLFPSPLVYPLSPADGGSKQLSVP